MKLLAIAERVDDGGARSPCGCTRRWCPTTHPLASVRDSYNAVFVEGDAVGDAHVLRPRRRRRARRPARCSATSSTPRATSARDRTRRIGHARPRPRSARSTRRVPSTTCSLEVADRPGVLARGRRRVRAATTCRSARWSRRASATTPASSSSPTPPARPTCRPRSATCATSTSCDRVGGASCGSSARLSVVKYVSTRGAAPVARLRATCCSAGLARDGGPVRARVVADAARDRRRAERPTPSVAADGHVAVRRGRIDRDEFAAIVRRRLRDVRPPRRVPARASSADGRVAARAVPRPDAGVQGRRPPARRPAVRPRADAAAASGSRSSVATSGDTGLGGHRGVPRPADASTSFVLHPAGRVSRGAAPADDDGRRAERPQHRASRARSTTARTW